jgi:glucose/arabinose dehydrogenase
VLLSIRSFKRKEFLADGVFGIFKYFYLIGNLEMKNITQNRLIFALCILTVLCIAAIFLSLKTPDISGQTQSMYSVNPAFPTLIFSQPVGIVPSSDGTNRLFVIEQAGVIHVFENSPTVAESTVFLNISTKVLFGGEQGLLGLAFHPNYELNGYFYINYVAENPLRTVISRYSVNPNNPDQAVENSELVILEINQPFSNHKGGQIAFGDDGYLYIGLGDGGSGGDPFGNAQNRSTLLGKILCINIDLTSQGRNYSIPLDNPYSGNTLGYKEEIYAFGFRNPWRFSFDSPTGRLWVADVGQNQREEIDIVEKGKNYGWNIMEGTLTYSSGSQIGLDLPVWEYSRAEGIAVIGGYVYHGSTLTDLNSKYIYGDYGSGKVWALQYDGGVPINTLLADTDLNISSFGVDERNELYFCSIGGEIYLLKDNVFEVPSPSPNPSQPPSSTPASTPIPPLSATPITTPSQNPLSSPSPQVTSTLKPQHSNENSPLLYIIILVVAFASIVTIVFILKKRR